MTVHFANPVQIAAFRFAQRSAVTSATIETRISPSRAHRLHCPQACQVQKAEAQVEVSTSAPFFTAAARTSSSFCALLAFTNTDTSCASCLREHCRSVSNTSDASCAGAAVDV